MSAREEHPAKVRPDNGGMSARRVMAHWAWRLFCREWHHQLLGPRAPHRRRHRDDLRCRCGHEYASTGQCDVRNRGLPRNSARLRSSSRGGPHEDHDSVPSCRRDRERKPYDRLGESHRLAPTCSSRASGGCDRANCSGWSNRTSTRCGGRSTCDAKRTKSLTFVIRTAR
jgi:hypothetical protein